MSEVRIKGSSVILSIYDEDAAAYLPIGCLTTNATNETVETQTGTVTKCEPNPQPVLGAYSYTKTFSGEAVENNTSLASMDKVKEIMRDKAAAKESIWWREVTTLADSSTKTEYGEAFFTEYSDEAPADGMVTFSGTFQGIGVISTVDPSTTTTTTV